MCRGSGEIAVSKQAPSALSNENSQIIKLIRQKYWQVADQLEREGPGYIFKVDSGTKEEVIMVVIPRDKRPRTGTEGRILTLHVMI